MIHHISIAADNPLHVAQVLAKLFNGKAIPFPAHLGSYVALALDTYGTMIEVHPHGTELRPGTDKDDVRINKTLIHPLTRQLMLPFQYQLARMTFEQSRLVRAGALIATIVLGSLT